MPNRQPPKALNFDKFCSHFRDESDRACAVLGGGLLDVRLEQLFRSKFVQGNDHMVKELLDFSGPVGAFSARIKMAYALGWIDDDLHSDLRIIKDLRNDFAHLIDVDYSFDAASVADRCRALRTAKALIEGHEQAKANPSRQVANTVIDAWIDLVRPPRARFEISIEMIAQRLADLASAPPSMQFLDEVRQLGAASARPWAIVRHG